MLTDECALPRPILVDSILPYLDLRSLVRFTGVSKLCKDAVFRDMAGAHWSKVDLSGNQILTDDQLRVFLENINAKENTRVLSLVGCTGVSGVGLEPLRGSRVLEDIDLRVLGSLPLAGEQGELCGPSGLDEDSVLDILTSGCPPDSDTVAEILTRTRLRRVAVRPQGLMGSGFRFRLPFLEKLFSQHAGYSLIHMWHFPVTGLFVDEFHPNVCSLCYARTHKSDDPPSEHRPPPAPSVLCKICEKNFCLACAMPPACSQCEKQMCQWCGAAEQCARCNKRSCATCANYAYESCGGCDKMFCQDCKDQELEGCVMCNGCYCSEVCHKQAHR